MSFTDDKTPSADIDGFELISHHDDNVSVSTPATIQGDDFEKESTPTTDAIVQRTLMLRLATPELAKKDTDIEEVPARVPRPLPHGHGRHHHHARGPRPLPPPGFEHSGRGKPHGRPGHGGRGMKGGFGPGARHGHKHRHSRAYSPPGIDEIRAAPGGLDGRHHPGARGIGRRGHGFRGHRGPHGHGARHGPVNEKEDGVLAISEAESDTSIATIDHHHDHPYSFPSKHHRHREVGHGGRQHVRGDRGEGEHRRHGGRGGSGMSPFFGPGEYTAGGMGMLERSFRYLKGMGMGGFASHGLGHRHHYHGDGHHQEVVFDMRDPAPITA
ncbi:hypothetical protein IAR50_007232 [Cryptococcus sp. DSM 104548]